MAGDRSARDSREMRGRFICVSTPARRALVTGVLGLTVVACSGQAGAPSLQPAPSPAPTTIVAVTAAPTAKPMPAPRTPAPAELQGRWQTVINDADKPFLTLTDFKYTIERGLSGTGSIAVAGDHISFFGSNLCSGTGQYTWSLVSGTLRFDSVTPDPCQERSEVIWNRPFKRVR